MSASVCVRTGLWFRNEASKLVAPLYRPVARKSLDSGERQSRLIGSKEKKYSFSAIVPSALCVALTLGGCVLRPWYPWFAIFSVVYPFVDYCRTFVPSHFPLCNFAKTSDLMCPYEAGLCLRISLLLPQFSCTFKRIKRLFLKRKVTQVCLSHLWGPLPKNPVCCLLSLALNPGPLKSAFLCPQILLWHFLWLPLRCVILHLPFFVWEHSV